MKTRYLQILIFVAALASAACAKKEIPFFETDDTGIYFQRMASYIYGTTTENYSDSTVFSFANSAASVTQYMISAEIRTMGKLSAVDRPVRVVVDKELTTAQEGYHYECNLDTIAIPAGSNRTYARIRFFRTPDLLNGSVRLVLKLEDNEHFTRYFPTYKNTNVYTTTGKQISGIEYKMIVNETYNEPSYWSNFGDSYFGPWTPSKYIVVNTVCGWTPADWSNAGFAGATIALGRFSFAATQVQKYLQEKADAGEPEREADGSLMQLADGYLVDYSAYE